MTSISDDAAPLAILSNPDISILYIEDNSANLILVQKVIEKKTAFRFLSAADPVSGLELAISKQPDLILLDIFLPIMDGYEVMKRFRENELTANIPVIALSANVMQADIQRSIEAGFAAYVPKPINIASFLEQIARVLEHSLIERRTP